MTQDKGTLFKLELILGRPVSASVVRSGKEEELVRAFGRSADLLKLVGNWLEERWDRVAQALVLPGSEELDLFVVSKSEVFDFQLNRELADFAIALFQRGWPVNARLYPVGSAESLATLPPPLFLFRSIIPPPGGESRAD